MPTNEINFKDFIRLQRGFDLPKEKRNSGRIPVVASTSITGYHDEYKIEAPGVVTGRSGALGEVQYIKENFWPLNTTLWVKDFKGNYPRYVYYVLKTLDLKRFNSGAGVPTLNRNDLDAFIIKIYKDKLQQEKISAILSSYDELIENNNRRIKILEEIAKKIYKHWFVDFKFPGYEKIKFVDSKLGKIPEGWEPKKINELADVIKGKSYKSSELGEYGQGIPFINLKSIQREGGFRRDGLKWFTGKYKESNVVKANDIIMAVTDMTQERAIVARCARVPSNWYKKFIVSMDLVKIIVKDIDFSDFLYCMLRFSKFADETKIHANGANVLHLSSKSIENYIFLRPTEHLYKNFNNICSNIFKVIDNLELKNENLSNTRDLLIPKLISGEIFIEDIKVKI